MYGVELYAAVRLAVVDEGLSHHEAGRRFGIDRRPPNSYLPRNQERRQTCAGVRFTVFANRLPIRNLGE